MKVCCYILISFIWTSGLQAQRLSSDERDFLNKEIRFLNETVHRMVIVFQVYENYNREISDHIDIPTNSGIKNTSEHLPDNLFADNDLVRSGDSPLEIYSDLNSDPIKDQMPINNWGMVEEAKKVIDFLNRDRKRIDNIIKNENLDKFANIQAVYEEIEKALDHYDKMRSTIKIFEKFHLDIYHNQELPKEKKQVYTALLELHYDVKKIVRQLRDDSRSGVSNRLSKLEKELGWLKACISELSSKQQQLELYSVASSILKLVKEIKFYLSEKPSPEEYKPYGKGYYYHNYELLPKINQYGSGYVWKLQEFFKKHDWPVLSFIEEPHYIKVIYPEVIPLDMMTDDSIDPEQSVKDLISDQLPRLDKIIVETAEDTEEDHDTSDDDKNVSPPVVITSKEIIKVDSAFFEISLYDHLRKDGDRVSINVNGEWVHRGISLEKTNTNIKLAVSRKADSYIVIRADNEGWSTPNTIGVSYKAKNSENNISIRKDLKTNEALEIRFVQ